MSCCDDLIKSINLFIAKADDDLKKNLKKKGYKNVDDTVSLATDLENKVIEELKNNTEDIVNDLKDVDDINKYFNDSWPALKNAIEKDKVLVAYIHTAFSDFVIDTANKYLKDIDSELSIETTTNHTTKWIKSWSQELGKKMKLKEVTSLEKILIDGIDNGNSIDDIIADIQAYGIREDYYYARATAITEVLGAHSVAQQEAYTQCPAIDRKQWRHSGDKGITPRENHVDMDGQIVDVNEPYELQGADGETYYPMFPRDTSLPAGERINCHCLSQGIVNDDILGLTLEERKELQQQAIDEINDSDFLEKLEEENKKKAGIDI